MEKILVTGANGYIGKHVVKFLLSKGYEVIASDFRFDNVDDRATKLTVPIFTENKEIYKDVGRPDICIHLAWKDGFLHNSPAHIENLSNHFVFCKNMLDGGLKHISVMGSMHEIGYHEGSIDENTPTNPLSLYGVAKNSLRQSLSILLNNYEDVFFQWLRAYYILGDDKSNNSIFTKIIEKSEQGEKIFPFTSGKNKFDFISVDELAEQISVASIQKTEVGIINCCSGTPISLAEKVETFIKENGFEIKLGYNMYPDRPYDSPGVWGDNKKIQKIMKDFKDKESDI